MGTIHFLVVFATMAATSEAVNPGVQVRISQSGLDYAARQALASLGSQVQGQTIPDQEGSAHTGIGKVKYWLRNMRISGFNQGTAGATVTPSGLTLNIANVGVSLHGDWKYEYKKIIKVRDHGSFDVSVEGASISVGILLGIDQATGRPTIASSSCSDDIHKVKVKFHGGASWLYNLFDDNVARSLKSNLKDTLCKSALRAINEDGAKKLATMKVTVPLKDIGELDYRLVAAPQFQNGYIDTGFKGEVFWTGDHTEAPFSAPVLPPAPANLKMATFWITDYVINTMTNVMHQHGFFKQDLTASDLDPKDQGLLNTTCNTFICIGNMLPKIVREKYPNSSVAISFDTTEAPKLNIASSAIAISTKGNMNFSVFPQFVNDRTPLFNSIAEMDIAIKIEMKEKKIVGKVDKITPKISVTSSSIGDISKDALSGAFKLASDFFIKKKINDVLSEGLDIPNIDDVHFVDPQLIMMQDAICLTTDVTTDLNLYFKKGTNDII